MSEPARGQPTPPAPPAILGTTTPRGLLLDSSGRFPLLIAVAGGDGVRRMLGWYYGYPACCVEAFIRRVDGSNNGPLPEPTLHPVSGHVLCAACVAGPPAPLPPRIADHYGFASFDDDYDEWSVEPPCGYGGMDGRPV